MRLMLKMMNWGGNLSSMIMKPHYIMMTIVCTSACFAGSGTQGQVDEKFVTLSEAHRGTLYADLKILNQFEQQPAEVEDFYIHARDAIFRHNARHHLEEVCERYGRELLGGPMLGDLRHDRVTVRVQFPKSRAMSIVVTDADGGSRRYESKERLVHHLCCDGLAANTSYQYKVMADGADDVLAQGRFTTAPAVDYEGVYQFAIGADFHKIGLHRPELLDLVRERGNIGMMLLGDLAVDGRQDNIAHRNVDYLLRDVSPVWQRFAAHVPTFTSWDDHDYFGDDSGGTYYSYKKKIPINVTAMRANWKKMWNNPERTAKRNGIYFKTNLGPADIIMLDTRSCRVNDQRGEMHSFLGDEQTQWALEQIKKSTAPYLIISSGTMWTDYISAGKDSWGTWDLEGREEFLSALDEKDSKVILFSGDRHGAHAFEISRPNGKVYTEFGVGSLGGVPGGGRAKDQSAQLFAYPGAGTWAFGELEFDTSAPSKPTVEFRLINEQGAVMETVSL